MKLIRNILLNLISCFIAFIFNNITRNLITKKNTFTKRPFYNLTGDIFYRR